MADFHGVVYTKAWVSNLILDLAGYSMDKALWAQTVVEPSCGHGSFLVPIISRLLSSAKRDDKINFEALKNCIVAYDLDPEAVNTCRSRASEALISVGLSPRESDELSKFWVRQEDYLLADTPSCDYVIGNPPYLRSSEIPEDSRARYCAALSCMTKSCDIYIGFIEKGLVSLNNEYSVLCYICADRWLQNQYGKKLRNLISQYYHIDSIIRMHDVDAFEEDVSAYPAIVKVDRGEGKIKYVNCSSDFSTECVPQLKSWIEDHQFMYDDSAFSATLLNHPTDGSVLPLSDTGKISIISSLISQYPSLEESGVKLGIGLATGRDDVFLVNTPDIVESERMLPAFNMRSWRRGKGEQNFWLINPWNRDGSLVNLKDYPRFSSYMETHRAAIAGRHVARKNADAWYRTIDKVNWSIYGEPMLLFPDMAMRADPVYSDGSKYPCHNCYWLVSDRWDIKVLGGLLMSDIAESFIDALGVKMRGGTMRFQAQYLRLIHVPEPESIPANIADALKDAFEKNDRLAASKAASIAYGLEV